MPASAASVGWTRRAGSGDRPRLCIQELMSRNWRRPMSLEGGGVGGQGVVEPTELVEDLGRAEVDDLVLVADVATCPAGSDMVPDRAGREAVPRAWRWRGLAAETRTGHRSRRREGRGRRPDGVTVGCRTGRGSGRSATDSARRAAAGWSARRRTATRRGTSPGGSRTGFVACAQTRGMAPPPKTSRSSRSRKVGAGST